jgi:NAD(P)H-hydrate epimerase
VLVIGGDHGMTGAARLAGEAALRSGAGMVSLATRPEHAALIAAACPELMCHGVTAARSLSGICGAGNNGGDGFVIGRLALEAGWQVQLFQLGNVAQMQADAQQARDAFLSAGGQVQAFTENTAIKAEVIVDALLGTGVDRPLQGLWRSAIEIMNAATAPVLAVDVPSGLQADTGTVAGVAIKADQTVTFIGRKAGLYTGAAADHCGNITFADLGVPEDILKQVPVAATLRRQPPLGRLPATA